MGKYFGTDGIRGEVNKDLTEELAFKVGKALRVLNCKDIVIGYDTRESNKMLYNVIAGGAMLVGLNVIDAGVITTPGLCYYSKEKEIVGVMITASHNPYQDNGIKIFLNGQKLTDELEELVEDKITNSEYNAENKRGAETKSKKPAYMYLDFLAKIYSKKGSLRIGLDCANGATSFLAEKAFSEITDNLYVIANKPDGRNINKECGATFTKTISSFVLENNLDIGFSFDGDGDRLMVCDSKGKVFSGDEMLYIMANYLKEKNRLVDNTIVLTVMSNIGLINSFNKAGIKTVTTSVGDRNVLEKMLEFNYSIGGENSGHFIISELMNTGDGMVSALFLLSILEEYNKTIVELLNDVVIYPDKLVSFIVKDKAVVNEESIVTRVKEINDSLGKDGLLIVRASGTENLVRVSCCAPTQELVDNYINELVELVNSF